VPVSVVYYATRFINDTLDTSLIRHERSVVERVFNKRVSREVYKRAALYFFYDQMNNVNITRNFFIQRF
jgi:hypothetical protein